MSNKNNKFQTSEVEVAMVPSVGTLPPVKIELSVDAAQAHTHNQQHLATDHLLPNLRQRTISSGHLTGIGMALWQYGYSALVGGSVIQAAVRLVLAWLISRSWASITLPKRSNPSVADLRRESYCGNAHVSTHCIEPSLHGAGLMYSCEGENGLLA